MLLLSATSMWLGVSAAMSTRPRRAGDLAVHHEVGIRGVLAHAELTEGADGRLGAEDRPRRTRGRLGRCCGS